MGGIPSPNCSGRGWAPGGCCASFRLAVGTAGGAGPGTCAAGGVCSGGGCGGVTWGDCGSDEDLQQGQEAAYDFTAGTVGA